MVGKCICGRTKFDSDEICFECRSFIKDTVNTELNGLTSENVEERTDRINDRAAEVMFGDYQSKRYNSGKVQTREIDPNFILGIGEVLTKSREKYDHFNWCKPTKLSTPYESMMRHIMAFQSGEDFDKETQSHHLLHAATNLMFMYYHITNNPEDSDDRFFKKDKKK